MQQHKSIFLLIVLSALFFVACTSDEEERPSYTATLSIPFAVSEDPTTAPSPLLVRATGDPGIDENLPAPVNLYIWLDCVDDNGADQLLYFHKSSFSWQKRTDNPERWATTCDIDLNGASIQNGSTLQVYAIASQNIDLSTSFQGVATVDVLRKTLFDITSSPWSALNAQDLSYHLGNLYSSPLALMGDGNDDALAAKLGDAFLHNGTYTVINDGKNIKLQELRPTRLYHCAAKADFKWEVAEALQPTVSVSTITLKNLPTTLKVFTPTHNPAGSATCPLLGNGDVVNLLNDGNKWLGREYAYVLQPPTTTSDTDGKLKYDVEFTGKSKLENQLTSPAINPVFTTWYRINANINN